MKQIWRCNDGATAVEFALLVVPVLTFIFGIMQIAYIVWVDNVLQMAVNTAARCGAVNSMTAPCAGSSEASMAAAANAVASPLDASYSTNASCPAGTIGLVGTYTISIVFVVNVTVTTTSCYPSVPVPA
jgi:Flp pilus assembly protein TadG